MITRSGWTVRVYTDEKEFHQWFDMEFCDTESTFDWLWRKLGIGFKQLWEEERKSNDEAWTKEKSDEI
jgi:hypothetical protein